MWCSTRSFAAVALLASRSLADLHHLFTSSYTSPDIFVLEFDDKARTIKQLQQFAAHGSHPGMTFSYDKTVLYAGEQNGWASYNVGGDQGLYALAWNASVPLKGECVNEFANYTWGYSTVISEARGPYIVYGAPPGDCGNAIAVTTDLDFDYVSQNISYNKPNSAVKGMAMDPDNTVLYTADLGANGIWVHSINPADGLLTNIGFLPAHLANAGPRKVLTHPSGKYLFVLLERASIVAVYAINRKQANGYPVGPISFTGLTYSLIPKGENPANYWGSDMSITEDGFTLLATTRYKLPSQVNSWDTVPPQSPYVPPSYQYSPPVVAQPPPQQQPYQPGYPQPQPYQPGYPQQSYPQQNYPSYPQQDNSQSSDSFFSRRRTGTGYVTAIQLSPPEDGSMDPATASSRVGAGYPLHVLFQQQTSASGGMSNRISAAPGNGQYFAITDSEYGVVEVWKIDGNDVPNFSGPLGAGALTATQGGWIQGTWSQAAALAYDDQYAPDTGPANPALASQSAGFNTTVPRPFVPTYYQSPPGRPGSTPTPAPAPAPPKAAQPPRPSQAQPRPQQPYRPNQYQPYQPQYAQPQQYRPQYTQYPQSPQYQQPQYQQPQYQQPAPARPTQTQSPYRPYTSTDTSWDDWRSRVVGNVRRWLGYESRAAAKRQAAPVPVLTPGVSARVYAAWQAGYVNSTGAQAGCCTNALWFD